MAGRRHVVANTGRKSHDGDGPGTFLGGAALHRRSSSEATTGMSANSSPSSTPTATPAPSQRSLHFLTTTSSHSLSKEKDTSFDISRLPFFGDRDRDRDHHHHHHHLLHRERDRDKSANLSVAAPSDMPARSASPVPPSGAGSMSSTPLASAGAMSLPASSKLHTSPSKVRF